MVFAEKQILLVFKETMSFLFHFKKNDVFMKIREIKRNKIEIQNISNFFI